jgi:outer membrane putative beta-barrel porin/alpha-amylase
VRFDILVRARVVIPLVVVATLTGAPRRASAAACCVSATSFGVGRLLAWEDAAVGLQLSHARSLGVWDASGALRWNGSDFSDGLTTTMAWGIVRVVDRVQLQAWIPYVVNDRASSGETQVAGGIGDVGAAARVEVLKIGEYVGLPSFAFTAGALAPTGKRIEETSPPLFAGATGRGAWGGTLAIESEYAFLPWFVRADAGLTAFLPFTRSDTGQEQQYGPILQASFSTGRELVPDVLVAALAVTGEWQSALKLDGATVPDSEARSLSLAASLAWRFDPRWTVNASVNNTVWPDGAGENRDARLGFTLGVRRGHF